MIEDEWTGCYSNKKWHPKLHTTESNAHPAKMSWGLLERIFKELEKMQLLAPDDVILDPLSGTGRTNIYAGLKGHPTISVELESHFMDMMKGFTCSGKTVETKLMTVCGKGEKALKEKPCPLEGHKTKKRGFMDKRGNLLDESVNRTVYCDGKLKEMKELPCHYWYEEEHEPHWVCGNKEFAERHTNKKCEWNMIQGDARELSKLLQEKGLVGITSPPYSNSQTHPSLGGTDKDEWGVEGKDIVKRRGLSEQSHYSSDSSNIGNLPDKGLIGITSPPFENQVPFQDKEFMIKSGEQRSEGLKKGRGNYASPEALRRWAETKLSETYSTDPENIGNQKDETYLSAMASVYAEAAKVCKVLVTVTKNPTRAGKLRRLDLDTIQLCRQAGFEPVAWFRARLFEKQEQSTLDKDKIEEYKGRISFFKRLSLDKGNVAADCEDIIIFVNKNDGELVGVTNPPYSEAQTGGGIAIDGYRGEHMDKQGKNQPDKVGERCGYMKEKHGSDPRNIGNLPDKEK